MGWCDRWVAGLRRGVVLVAAGIAAVSFGLEPPLAAAVPQLASGGPGSDDRGSSGLGLGGDFTLTPALGPQGQPTSYFQLAVAPGQAVTATVVVANLADHPQTLALGRAVGVTAGIGGSAYDPVARRCSGTACWVSGLPGRVTLGPAFSESLSFTVRVPPWTPPGQYLAGITARPVTLPTAVSLGSDGSVGMRAFVIRTLTVGVAVTVGNVSSLVSRLSIRGVRGTTSELVPRLSIGLYNSGQTFAKGTGQAACRVAGRWQSQHFYADTVLPGDHSLIPVNVAVPLGVTVPCAVRVRYGEHQVARWSGLVTISAGNPPGKGAYGLLPQSGTVDWEVALIITGLLLAAAGLWFYWRRRPRWR